MSSRRNFIKTCTRTVIAGTLVGSSAYLLLRENAESPCTFTFPCDKCKKIDACEDQKAREFKNQNNPQNGGQK